MAITYPLDLLAGFPGWSTEFDLLSRDEFSRTANGRTIPKNLGSPLWRASYTTRSLRPNQLDEWRARLSSLENGQKTFKGYPTSRCRPIAHPGSAVLPTGSLFSIDANRKAIRITALAGVSLSVGDMIQIGTKDLHQVMEPVDGPVTGLFEVRPHIWPGVANGAVVTIVRPTCIMAIVPGSISSTADKETGRGVVSFQAIEAR
ncbi:hypothetical protein [Aminobacter sp. AP02]|uniref:hypothetical protein n=1 Tax=Aminobacter sp. AP02 TaxID=2135737 RepID=UPI000D6B76E8|nr:hypothetical protein [Aminobacter sp. AP02]PWK65877.1 hypothetical protein C8K44_11592 [Aminobacter sp. AP02]